MVDFQSRDTRRGLGGSDDEEDAEENTAADETDDAADETADGEPSADDTAEPDDGSDAESEAAGESATESRHAERSGAEADSDETATPATGSEADATATPRPSGEPGRAEASDDGGETETAGEESSGETGSQTSAQEAAGPPGSKTAAGAPADAPSPDQGVTVDAAVVTVGTSGADTDPTGDALVSALEGAGHSVSARERLRGDRDGIQQSVDALVGRDDVDVVVTAGGTGIREDELAIEAVHPLLEKALPGFGEAFRTLLFDHIGTGIVAVRSTAGIANGTLVFCLPGDQQAATLAVEEILNPEAGELVAHLEG